MSLDFVYGRSDTESVPFGMRDTVSYGVYYV